MSQVNLILDEAAVLGHLDAIDAAVDIGRGYGIRFQFYYQSLGQLRTCFPDGQDQTLLSNVTQVFFAVNDNATADYVSARLGEETIVLTSGGTSHGSSWQSTSGAQPSSNHGGSASSNYNWQLQARKLLKPEEVIALHPRTAITFTPGVPPVRTWLMRYYEEKNFPASAIGHRRRGAHRGTLFKSAFVLVFLVCIAAMLTSELIHKTGISDRPLAKTEVGTQRIHPFQGAEHVQIQ